MRSAHPDASVVSASVNDNGQHIFFTRRTRRHGVRICCFWPRCPEWTTGQHGARLWHWPFILTQSRQEPEPQRKGSRERTENATIAASLGDGCRICRTDCGKFYSGGSRFDPDVEFAVPVAVNPTIVAQRGAGCRSFDPGDELIRAARRRCCAHCGWTAPVCRFGRPQPTWNGEQPFLFAFVFAQE